MTNEDTALWDISKLIIQVKCTCDLIKIVKKQRMSDHNRLCVFLKALKIHIPLRKHQTCRRRTSVHQTRHFKNQVNSGKINDSKVLMNSSNTNWKHNSL